MSPENYAEKRPCMIVIEGASEATKDAILNHIEEVEGHRIRRTEETNRGALIIHFDNLDHGLEQILRGDIWKIDQTVIIRDNLGLGEHKI